MDIRSKSPAAVKKAWGITVRVSTGARVWFALVKKGGYSSRHHHPRSVNEFFVTSGRLRILLFERHEDILRETGSVLLSSGQSLVLAAGVWHQFDAETDVELIETYTGPVGPDEEDIQRADEGGIR